MVRHSNSSLGGLCSIPRNGKTADFFLRERERERENARKLEFGN